MMIEGGSNIRSTAVVLGLLQLLLQSFVAGKNVLATEDYTVHVHGNIVTTKYVSDANPACLVHHVVTKRHGGGQRVDHNDDVMVQ